MLIWASLSVLRPFIPALIWAGMIVIATWPLMRLLQARLGGRRGLAVAVMSLGLLLVLIVPLYLAVASIVEHSGEIVALVKSIPTRTLPPPPDWVDSLPLVGEKIAAGWREIAAGGAGVWRLIRTPMPCR